MHDPAKLGVASNHTGRMKASVNSGVRHVVDLAVGHNLRRDQRIGDISLSQVLEVTHGIRREKIEEQIDLL